MDPGRFIVHAHQKVEAFMGLEAAIRRDPFQPRQSAIVNRGVTRNTSTQVGRKFSASVLVAIESSVCPRQTRLFTRPNHSGLL